MADPAPAENPIFAMLPHLDPLPYFVTPPDQVDQMVVVVAVFLLALIVGLGILYFSLHALPEKMAHKTNHTQMQLVGVMALLALFTHNNVFWVGALLLAALNVPDFLSPMNRIADALNNAAGRFAAADAAAAERARTSAEASAAAAPASTPAPASAPAAPEGENRHV